MESFRIVGPRPRADVLAAIERDRARREQRARRYTPPIETRANAGACPACGFGGFTGTKCVACWWTPAEGRRVEQRTAANHRAAAQREIHARTTELAGLPIEHGPTGPVIGVR